jgi:hypothetical protein
MLYFWGSNREDLEKRWSSANPSYLFQLLLDEFSPVAASLIACTLHIDVLSIAICVAYTMYLGTT